MLVIVFAMQCHGRPDGLAVSLEYGVLFLKLDTNCRERLLIAWVSTFRRESTREGKC